MSTKPLPENFDNVKTMGQVMDVVASCETEEEAQRVFEMYVDSIRALADMTDLEAREIAMGNIGYASGYYGRKTCERILKLFDTSHPFFGRRYPTPEEAFEIGKGVGSK
jgi:hypothetical protein